MALLPKALGIKSKLLAEVTVAIGPCLPCWPSTSGPLYSLHPTPERSSPDPHRTAHHQGRLLGEALLD